MRNKIKLILKNSDYRELLKKGTSALLIRILGFLSGFVYLYFVVKYFGVEVNGLLSLSFSVMIIGSLISRLGVDINMIKIFSISNNYNNSKGIFYKTFPIILLLSSFIAILVFIFSKQISEFVFHKPQLFPFLRWTSPSIVIFTMLLLNASVLRGMRRNSQYAFLFNGGRFLFTLIIFIIFYFFFQIKEPIIAIQAHTLGLLLLFTISFFFLSKFFLSPSLETNYRLFTFIKDSLPMLISASVIVLLGWSDRIILGLFKSSEIVGVYDIVIKISAITSFTFQALDSILAPKLSKAYHEGNMKDFQNLVTFSVKINTIISLFIVVFLIVFRNYILGFFGEVAIIGATTLIILSLAQLVNSICGPVGSILQMTGNQAAFKNILAISLIINIILNLFLAKPFGMIGVGIATAVSLLFWNITSVVYIKKKLNINLFKR